MIRTFFHRSAPPAKTKVAAIPAMASSLGLSALAGLDSWVLGVPAGVLALAALFGPTRSGPLLRCGASHG